MLQTNQKITVHVNNEQSRNCCSSRGLSVFAVEVPARTKMVQSLPEKTVPVMRTRKENYVVTPFSMRNRAFFTSYS